MDDKTIFSKTAKGLREASGASSKLPRNLRAILKEIDGKSVLPELQEKLSQYSEKELGEALERLETEGYIHDTLKMLQTATSSAAPPPASAPADDAKDFGSLDFTSLAAQPASPPPPKPTTNVEVLRKIQEAKQAEEERARRDAKLKAQTKAKQEAEEKARRAAADKAKREAEEQARKEAETKARREADEKARLETEARSKQEAEERARQEAEERVSREAEERARREAEENARRETDEKARREAEANARREAEKRAQKEADEKARREAEERARREADEKVQREAAEKARRDAEVKARREAEARAKKEAEEKARREAEEGARREAEEKAQREAEEKARRDAEERVRREAEARAQKEAEEHARREAEERARREAEEKAQREAEEKAKRDADEKARREAEERAQKEAEEHARREAEEHARREAEEKARREIEEEARRKEEQARQEAAEKERLAAWELSKRKAEEKLRQEAEAKARQEAEDRIKIEAKERAAREAEERLKEEIKEKARKEAEEKAEQERLARIRREAEEELRKEAKEKARRETEAEAARKAEEKVAEKAERAASLGQIRWGKLMALATAPLLALVLGAIHFVPFSGRIPDLEKAASDQFQVPVKIDSLHLALFPRPYWRLEGVTVGSEGQIKAPRVDAVIDLPGFGAYKSLAFESPVLKGQAVAWLLFGQPGGQKTIQFKHIRADNAVLETTDIDLPRFDVKGAIGADGRWQQIELEFSDHGGYALLRPDAGNATFEINASNFLLPLGGSMQFDDFTAKGTFDRNEMRVSEFEARSYGGSFNGNANIKWTNGWSLDGLVRAKQVDTKKLAPALLRGGWVDGKATYAMHGKNARSLLAAPHVEGSFTVSRGEVLGVDLMHLLQNAANSGKTGFREASGSFVRDGDVTQIRQLRMDAGIFSASGNADLNANGTIRGRFATVYRFDSIQKSGALSLSGTLQAPKFSR